MMKRIKYIAIGLMIFGFGLSTYAQQERALPILTQGHDASVVALGGNHYGTSHYAHIYGNPTSALYADHPGTISSYYQHTRLGEASLRALGASGSYRLGTRHVILAGARYFGGLHHTEITLGETRRRERLLYDLTVDFGYGIRLGKFSLYASGTYILSDQMRAVSTMTASVGASYRGGLSLFGQSVQYVTSLKARNLGTSFTYIKDGSPVYPPSSVGIGGELSTVCMGMHGIRLGAGVEHYYAPSQAASSQILIGGEYSYRGMVMARLGYNHDTNGLSSLSLGLGGAYRVVRADLSYTLPNNDMLSPQLALSMGVSF